MRILPILGSIALLGSLAACNTPPPLASTQMTPASGGSSAAMPVTTNSLPANTSVNAPRAAPTGVVGVSRP